MESLHCFDEQILKDFVADRLMRLTRTFAICKKATKKTISRSHRNNYISCWDAACKPLYTTFLQSSQGDDAILVATALLAKLDRKQKIDGPKQFEILTFRILVVNMEYIEQPYW